MSNALFRLRLAAFLILLGLAAGCGKDAPPPVEAARPVVATTLTELSPEPEFVVTGVAEPYRKAELSFEVSGRITAILDVGRTVEIHTREKTPEELAAETAQRRAADDEDEGWKPDPLAHEGDLIAMIDDTSYRQRFDAASLRLKTAEAGLKAHRLDLDEVAPATVARAKAQRDAALSDVEAARASITSAQSSKDTAERDLERNRQLLRVKQISPSEFDQYKNAFETAAANLAKAEAGLKAKQDHAAAYEATFTEVQALLRLKAENVAKTEAEIEELKVAVDQARTDLERCVLKAPFAGRITHVVASQGDFVSAGKPVLTLTLIDPIKVSVTVSAERERLIQPGNYARVRPKELRQFKAAGREAEDELFGTVFEKGAVADPATRTFRIDVMVRNKRRLLARDVPKDVLRIDFRQLLPAVDRNFGEGGPLFVCRTCCVPDAAGHFVYRLKGAKFSQPRPAKLFADKLELEKLEVRAVRDDEQDFMQILNWSFVHVEPVGNGPRLENGDLLLNFDERLDPKKIGSGVVMERYDWALRPGDLVPVTFDGKALPRGFWVPDDAIRAQNEKRSIFAIEDGKAKELPVTVHESTGRLWRIEGAGLAAGKKVVMVGVQYVYDGGPVVISEEEDLERVVEERR